MRVFHTVLQKIADLRQSYRNQRTRREIDALNDLLETCQLHLDGVFPHSLQFSFGFKAEGQVIVDGSSISHEIEIRRLEKCAYIMIDGNTEYIDSARHGVLFNVAEHIERVCGH